jgi:hypothetical protein
MLRRVRRTRLEARGRLGSRAAHPSRRALWALLRMRWKLLRQVVRTCNNKKDLVRGPFLLTRRDCNGQIASVIHFFNSLFGAAPTFEEAILPSLNSISVGMLRMP